MESINSIRKQLTLYLTFFAVITFLCAQAWDMATTTDAAIVLWLVGLGYAVADRGFPAFSRAQRIISILSLATFASYVVSWWGTPYVREIGQLEPAGRFLILPLIMYAMVRSGMTLRMLAWALIASGFSYAVSAFYEKFYLHLPRVNGDENAVTFGNGAILIFACMSTILFSLKRKREITLVGLSAVLVFIAAIYSGSRASLIVLLPLAVILTTIYKKRALPFLIVGAIGLTVFALSSNYLTKNVQRSYASIEAYIQKHNTGTSLGQRFLLWESTVCINELHPWWGIGPKVFENVMKDKNDPCHIKVITKKHYFTHAHSLYFHSLATKGILGSLILLSFFAGIIWFSIKKQFALSYMTLAAVLTMLTYGISMDLFYTRYIIDKHTTLLGILMGITALTSARTKNFGTPGTSKDFEK